MEIMEIDEEKTEAKKNPTTWLIKCTHDQKESLQKKASQSGKSVAQFLLDSVQSASLKESLSNSNDETQKEFALLDDLLERLNHLLYSKMYLLIEKEKVAQELKNSMVQKEGEFEKEFQVLKEDLMKEFNEKTESFKTHMEDVLEKEKQTNQEAVMKLESDLLKEKERTEDLEERLQKVVREKEIVQKQYTESMRSYEIADERLTELRLKTKELEEKLKTFETTKDKNYALEKEVTILQIKLETLVREEALKREYFEKDLKREFDVERRKYQDNTMQIT